MKILAGRYEIHEKIGEGGMAVVYKAKCRLLKRNVAIKMLKPEFTHNRNFIDSFVRESRAAAKLSHPNIVSIYDVGREGDVYYMVMELVEGKLLSDLIDRGPMKPKAVVDIAIQVVNALAFAHQNKIIHRDIKPHNILINSEGVAKITDFGIARAMDKSSNEKNTEAVIMGSAHYFSPEQANGKNINERSDIYSFGVVMYEMITGRVPFDGKSALDIAIKHIGEEPKPIESVISGVPKPLIDVINKALQKRQTDRYETADELFEDLLEVQTMLEQGVMHQKREKPMNEGAVRKREEGPLKKKSKKNNKKKYIIVGIAAVALLAAIIFAVSGGFSGSENKIPDFKGKTIEEAKEAIKNTKYTLKEGEEVYDNDVEKGKIAKQEPDAGETIKGSQEIVVHLSKGPEDGRVPNVVGKTEEEAKKIITDAGFKVGDIERKPSSKDKGTVIEQSPKAGKKAEKDEEISIVVSSEKEEKARVPDLKGMSESQAKEVCASNDLKMAISGYIESDQEKDKVAYQSIKPGEKVKKDTTIYVKLSKGKSESAKTKNIMVDFSKAPKGRFRLQVEVSDKNGTRTVLDRYARKSEGGTSVKVKATGRAKVVIRMNGKIVESQYVNFN